MAADTPRYAAESTYAATGIPGLDTALGGGVLRRHLYVIEGPPGAGKTTLALHFLLAGRDNHERCLWLTTAETPDELQDVAQAHGWVLDGIEVFALPNTMELIQLELKRIVQPIPAKPREMHIVTFDRLATGGETAVPLPRSSTVAPEAGCEV